MNEKFIQTLLLRRVLNRSNHIAAVPNSTQLLYGEADLLSVTKAGLVHEFEIKCSRADYNRDFKTKPWKHQMLADPSIYIGRRIANYYWFVTFGFEIEPPAYAGWMTVDPIPESYEWYHEEGITHWLSQKKNAPRLHKRKWDDAKIAKIARLLSYRLLKEYENNAPG